MKLQFAGANNSLYLIRDNELTQVKPDKMPIGIYRKEKESFTAHEIDILEKDVIYLFSDGYMDQFGGPLGKKFLSSNFKDLLHSIHPKEMKQQEEILEKTMLDWRNDYEQIDDILVIGIRF